MNRRRFLAGSSAVALAASAVGCGSSRSFSKSDNAEANLRRHNRLPVHPTFKLHKMYEREFVELVKKDAASTTGEVSADVWREPDGKTRFEYRKSTLGSYAELLKKATAGDAKAVKELMKYAGEIKNFRPQIDRLLKTLASSNLKDNPKTAGDFTRLYGRAVLDASSEGIRMWREGDRLECGVHAHDNGTDHSEADLQENRHPEIVLAYSPKSGRITALYAHENKVWRLGRIGSRKDHMEIRRIFARKATQAPKVQLWRVGKNLVVRAWDDRSIRCAWAYDGKAWRRQDVGRFNRQFELNHGNHRQALVIMDENGNHSVVSHYKHGKDGYWAVE
ncbi:MAG: hypothetical protein AABW54_03275 [Candidatus Micrarchaeota archaeon]